MGASLKLLVAAGLALAALAAQAEGGPCREDVRKYCSQVQGQGGKQVEDCLLDHQQDISDACYNGLKQRLEKGGGQGQQGQGGGALRACRQDLDRLCRGVEPGGGRLVNCLRDHQQDLSEACSDALSKKMQNRQQR